MNNREIGWNPTASELPKKLEAVATGDDNLETLDSSLLEAEGESPADLAAKRFDQILENYAQTRIADDEMQVLTAENMGPVNQKMDFLRSQKDRVVKNAVAIAKGGKPMDAAVAMAFQEATDELNAREQIQKAA